MVGSRDNDGAFNAGIPYLCCVLEIFFRNFKIVSNLEITISMFGRFSNNSQLSHF